jgi:hypothetical protein
MNSNEEQSILFYTTPTGDVNVQVLFNNETLWLPQKRMAELFGVDRSVITKHLKNIFESGELDPQATCAIIAQVQNEGGRSVSRNIEFYNLDAIIAVGYRVNSFQATQFRIWATRVLKEFIIKGFVLDDDRLKQGKQWGEDYFAQLLDRIREIRASERRFYQAITDIYQQCSVDYDPKAPMTQTFFATVQNKLHWAIHGHTASELIAQRADASKPNMGLTTWKNAPEGKILSEDVTVAKNYLEEAELKKLNRIVTMYLDYAESQAERQIPMTMQDWITKLDAFLQFNEYDLLKDAGKVQAKVAKTLALEQFKQFRVGQDASFESDFDQMVKRLPKKHP